MGQSTTEEKIKELRQRIEDIRREGDQKIEELRKRIEELEVEGTLQQKKADELERKEKEGW